MLYGWDTAYVASFETINQAIASQRSSPGKIDFQDKQSSSSLRGTFGAWQLSPGDDAAGGNICLAIPLQKAALVLDTGSGPPATSTVTYVFEATVQLEFSKKTSGDLKVRALGNSTASVVVDPGATDEIQYAGAFLEAWLQGNLATFAHVFSVAIPDMKALQPDWQWLMPVEFGYAVNGPAGQSASGQVAKRTTANCVFAVLCKLPGGDATGLPLQVDANALPAGQSHALLISQQVLLSRLVLPSVAKALYDQDERNLAVQKSPLLVTNTGTLQLEVVLPDPNPAYSTGWTFQGRVPVKLPAAPPPPPVKVPATVASRCFTAQFDGFGRLVLSIAALTFQTPDGWNEFSVDLSSKHIFSLSPAGALDLTLDGVVEGSVSVSLTPKAADDQLALNIAAAVIQAVLSVAPAAGAVKNVMTVGLRAAATDTVAVAASEAENAAGAEARAAATTEMAAASPVKWTAVKDMALKIAARMGLVLSYGAGSFLLTNWLTLQSMLAQKNVKQNLTPTLHDLAAELTRANLWNGAQPANAPRCVSAEIVNECLRLGLHFPAPGGHP